MPTVLAGDDKDLPILLCYDAQTGSQAIYFYSEPRAGISKNRIWDVNATKPKLGSRICSTVLYVHAFLGCGSTSRVYGIGKSAGLQLLIKTMSFTNALNFSSVVRVGSFPTLNQLCHLKFIKKFKASASYVESEVLSPTSDDCSFHSFRVY